MDKVKFHSKVLLFGEYGIIKNSKGIAIPCKNFYGVLEKTDNPDSLHSDLKLHDFYSYLKNSGILSKEMNLEQLNADIHQGLFFNSNIPFGHGVGSSGALCASVYYHYAYNFERKQHYSSDELKYLQDIMALMESFYHGTSSGLDCLISLIDAPIVIDGRNNLKVVDTPKLAKLGEFYLFDSGINRKTGPLVHQFLKEFEENIDYQKEFSKFVSYTNTAIESLIALDQENLIESYFEISKWQYINFSNMIPKVVRDMWLDGLETKKFLVKLCGAGGGGFFLVYAPRPINLEKGILIHE